MAEKYFAELERMWRQKQKTGPALQALFCVPLPPGLQRPKALRGPDLVQELVRLALMTEDVRFGDALLALVEHRIVGRNYNFLPWEPKWRRRGKDKLGLLMCTAIHNLKSRCRWSLRRTCAELAARTRWKAQSFAAAVKDLELLYREHPRWHFDLPENMTLAEFEAVVEKVCSTDVPTLKLEKSCRTSIPTTADN
jgi:hypothetical protein